MWRWQLLLCVAVHLTAAQTTFHTIDSGKYPLAKCLDGSPGAFYFWPATSAAASNKWVIHHIGGGWCSTDVPDTQGYTVDSCYHRSFTALGSSAAKYYPQNATAGWTNFGFQETMIPDPNTNPLMHDWNKVALVYCDGGSFSGRNLQPSVTEGRTLHFRGSYNREAIMETLLHEHGLTKATDVVIGGDSAGGLSAYLHVDQWRAAIPATAFVVGLPDSGFFLDWSASKPAQALYAYAHELRANFFAFNASAGVNAACVAARSAAAGDISECYFAEHTAPFIKTPLFALQSTVDSWQLGNELGNGQNAELINMYRLNTISRLQETLLTGPTRGGFIDSCVHHCGSWNQLTVQVDGERLSSAKAFVMWYLVQRIAWASGTVPKSPMTWWQAKPYPCATCCNAEVPVLSVPDMMRQPVNTTAKTSIDTVIV